jgi:N utilization substance protein B
MTISDFFAHLGAPRRNVQWSWGAIGPDSQVYLAVWNDEFRTKNGRRFVQVTDSRSPDPTRHGDRERHDHIRAIQGGAKAFCVILTAVDPWARPRKIGSFDGTALMLGGELIADSEGRFWLEDAGRCNVPAPARQPRLVSSRPLAEERPRLAKRVDRRVSGGPSDRPVRQEPSPAAHPAGTLSGNPRGGRRARETPARGARERESIAGATRGRQPVRETALESLHRALDTPEGVFVATESRTESSRERHRARETALQLLYQWDVGRIGADDLDAALELFWTVHPAPAPRRELALGLARGAVGALPEIDLLIARHTDNWRTERLAVVDRLILRLAVYELLFEKTPPAVVINEALELAKTFSGERAVAFVNGVLDAVRRAVVQRDERSALGT